MCFLNGAFHGTNQTRPCIHKHKFAYIMVHLQQTDSLPTCFLYKTNLSFYSTKSNRTNTTQSIHLKDIRINSLNNSKFDRVCKLICHALVDNFPESLSQGQPYFLSI